MTPIHALVLVALLSAAGTALAEDLRSVERKLDDARRDRAELGTATTGILGEIETLDRRAQEATKELARADREAAKAVASRRAAQAELARLERERDRLRALLLARAPGLFRVSRRGLGPLLFEAAEDRETRQRHRRYVSSIAVRDHEILEAVLANREAAAVKRAAAADAERALVSLRRDRARALARVEQDRREKQKRLASLRAAGEEKDRLVGELEASAARLRELLRRKPPPGSSAGKGPDAWRWPLDRVGKSSAALNGIELAAERGASVRAVADGVVVFADWFPGYGRILVVDHGGHWHSIYGHAEDVLARPGERVSAGQAIATVGATGATGDPSLYFELRRRGEPRDPSEVLRERRVEKGGRAP